MTGPDLKQCPLCGGNTVRAFRHVPMQPDPCVMCRDCYASAVSVAAWNRRDPAVLAALPEVQAMIAAAEARGMERAAARARVYASNYEQSSDGRNTFILLAEWADAEAAAILARAEQIESDAK